MVPISTDLGESTRWEVGNRPLPDSGRAYRMNRSRFVDGLDRFADDVDRETGQAALRCDQSRRAAGDRFCGTGPCIGFPAPASTSRELNGGKRRSAVNSS